MIEKAQHLPGLDRTLAFMHDCVLMAPGLYPKWTEEKAAGLPPAGHNQTHECHFLCEKIGKGAEKAIEMI